MMHSILMMFNWAKVGCTPCDSVIMTTDDVCRDIIFKNRKFYSGKIEEKLKNSTKALSHFLNPFQMMNFHFSSGILLVFCFHVEFAQVLLLDGLCDIFLIVFEGSEDAHSSYILAMRQTRLFLFSCRLVDDDSVRFIRWMMLRIFKTALKCIYIAKESGNASERCEMKFSDPPKIYINVRQRKTRTTVEGGKWKYFYLFTIHTPCWTTQCELLVTFCENGFSSTMFMMLCWLKQKMLSRRDEELPSKIHHFGLFSFCLLRSVFCLLVCFVFLLPYRFSISSTKVKRNKNP